MRRLTKKNKNGLRQIRHARVRARLSGTAQKPRLSVFAVCDRLPPSLLMTKLAKLYVRLVPKRSAKKK